MGRPIAMHKYIQFPTPANMTWVTNIYNLKLTQEANYPRLLPVTAPLPDQMGAMLPSVVKLIFPLTDVPTMQTLKRSYVPAQDGCHCTHWALLFVNEKPPTNVGNM